MLDKQMTLTKVATVEQFQQVQQTPNLTLEKVPPIEPAISDSIEESEEEIAFNEYLRGGMFDEQSDAFFAAFGFNRQR